MRHSDSSQRTFAALQAHGLSLAEHYVMCSASYRVTYPPDAFVEHAFAASRGDRRGEPSLAELTAALEGLRSRGLLTCLTAADIEEEAARRAASTIPEVDDIGYESGMVDFTPRGYAVHQEVIRAIYGDDFARNEGGFNVDLAEGRFDVYAASAEPCRSLMDAIEADGDAHTGEEGTRVVERDGPNAIAQWRPNRFITRDTGYHGVVRFIY